MRRHFFLPLLLLCARASATDFYVDPVTGSNAGDGSAAHPWKTLQTVISSNLIQTRNWSSLPYHAGASLVAINSTAPVKAGDTLWLRSGYHGAVSISGAYNASTITVAAQPGQQPHLKSLKIRAAQNWTFRDLSVSPSYAPPLSAITMVDIDDDGYAGPSYDIDVGNFDIFSIDDASAWTANDWINTASDGVEVGSARVNIHDSRVRNVRFGIAVDGQYAKIQHNVIDGFSGDGMRGLGDYDLFEYNVVKNDYIGDPPDANHDDGFQSWSVGAGGVGTGVVTGIVLRGNMFINETDPNNPLRNSMQAIGCFDGFFDQWVVENNIIITDHWHGISFYGMTNSRIVNNTVIDMNNVSPGPPWIMVNEHKDGRPSKNVIVRNNLATDYQINSSGVNITQDHNVTITAANAAKLFVAPPYDLRLRSGSPAIDAGVSTSAPLIDIQQTARPQGAAFDLGAYEFKDDIFKDGFGTP
jgi:hypothetical protein